MPTEREDTLGMPDTASADMEQGATLAEAGRPAEARAAFERALAEADAAQDGWMALHARSRLGGLCLDLGEIKVALAYAQSAFALATDLEEPALAGFAAAVAGKAQVLVGDTQTGLQRLLDGLATVRRAGEPHVELAAMLLWVESLMAAGRHDEAREASAGARAMAATLGEQDRGFRLARCEVALAVCSRLPHAGSLAQDLVQRARLAEHPVALAHALRWHGEGLLRIEDAAAGGVLAEAAAIAAQCGLLGLVDDLADLSREGRQTVDGEDGCYKRMAALLPRVAIERDLGDVLAEALQAFVQLAEAERGFLLLFDGFTLIQQLSVGVATDEERGYSTSLAYRVLWSKESLFIQDMDLAATYREADSVQRLGLVSALGVPLLHGDEVIGVLLADNRIDRSPFARSDLDLAVAFAGQVAAIIVTKRELEGMRKAHRESGWLHRLALMAARASTLDELMRSLVPAIAPGILADRLIVFPDRALKHRLVYDVLGRPVDDPRAANMGIARWVCEHGKPLLIADVQADTTFGHRESVRNLGLRTLAATPLLDEDRVMGVLYADGVQVEASDPIAASLLRGVGEIVGAFLARQPVVRVTGAKTSRKMDSNAPAIHSELRKNAK